MGAISEKENGPGFGVWLGGQDAMLAWGVKTEDELDAGRFFQAEALRADGQAAIGADFEGGTHTPKIGPPRAAWGRREG